MTNVTDIITAAMSKNPDLTLAIDIAKAASLRPYVVRQCLQDMMKLGMVTKQMTQGIPLWTLTEK